METFSQPELVGEYELGGFSRLFSGLWIEKETAEEFATDSWEESEDYFEEICSTSGLQVCEGLEVQDDEFNWFGEVMRWRVGNYVYVETADVVAKGKKGSDPVTKKTGGQ